MQGLGIELQAGMPVLDLVDDDAPFLDVPVFKRPKVADIVAVVAQAYGLTVKDIKSSCRQRRYAWPRQIVMKLSRELTGQSYPQIATSLGGMDHSSIIFGCRRVVTEASRHPTVHKHLNIIRNAIVCKETVPRLDSWFPPYVSKGVARPRYADRIAA